jgi:hypothetical protein
MVALQAGQVECPDIMYGGWELLFQVEKFWFIVRVVFVRLEEEGIFEKGRGSRRRGERGFCSRGKVVGCLIYTTPTRTARDGSWRRGEGEPREGAI